jgi:hypothetical protein
MKLDSKAKAQAVVDAFYLSLPMNTSEEMDEILEKLQDFIDRTTDAFWEA